jgi:cation:H+ antiporter
MVFITFIISAILVVIAGVQLSKYAEVIADKTGIGHSFIGVTLLALFTSLPEFISSIGAVTIVDAPDLSFGNVYGSNMFNIFIIFILDAVFRKGSIYEGVSISNITTGIFAVLITLISTFALLGFDSQIWNISIVGIIISFVFIFSVYSAFRHSLNESAAVENKTDTDKAHVPLSKAIIMFLIAAVVILGAGLMLSKSADGVAEVTGLGKTVVGSFMLAMVTSLPEISSSIGALRLGAPNMAIGNIFGSNVFNIFVIPVTDIFYRKGNIFQNVSSSYLEASIFASFIVILALLAIAQDKLSKLRIAHISIYSFIILGCYILYIVRTFN